MEQVGDFAGQHCGAGQVLRTEKPSPTVEVAPHCQSFSVSGPGHRANVPAKIAVGLFPTVCREYAKDVARPGCNSVSIGVKGRGVNDSRCAKQKSAILQVEKFRGPPTKP